MAEVERAMRELLALKIPDYVMLAITDDARTLKIRVVILAPAWLQMDAFIM